MAVDFPEHEFWDFSIGVYSTEGVPQACLVLQEKHRIDVNILLFCCWLGASGRGAMTNEETARMMEAVGPWNDGVVRALRAVRGRMKGGMPPAPPDLSDPLRRSIAEIEIDCEHVEQLVLAAAVDRAAAGAVAPEQAAADAVANIGGYLTALGARFDADDRAPLATILRPAFKEAREDRIAALCRTLEAA